MKPIKKLQSKQVVGNSGHAQLADMTKALCLLLLSGVVAEGIKLSVYASQGTFEVKEGVLDKSAAAMVSFEDDLLKTGWGTLDINTNSAFDDATQMEAAGIGEGYATASHIATLYANMLPITFRFGVFFGACNYSLVIQYHA